ncbi:dethiobiotin synthase [Flammeovirgaceae bacterium SG7u.111]|nr:dethiobiotin synthase [Flammeovirgaceae bacterium SG7u.132]WPO36461.1 dethiobiotin synthase [Flammeovirgaceae bacterium SG7u.111]
MNFNEKTYFISGIDTDCGKTYITGLLAKKLKNDGKNTITQKLVQTGCEGIAEDILAHRSTMECTLFPEDATGLTHPYVFTYPASPHLAARLDGKKISKEKLENAITELSSRYQINLVEGAGGLFVPLFDQYCLIDFLVENQYPLILVSSSKLGSINHTLLSLNACKSHKLNLQLLIYNQLPDADPTISDESFSFIKSYVETNFEGVEVMHGKELSY